MASRFGGIQVIARMDKILEDTGQKVTGLNDAIQKGLNSEWTQSQMNNCQYGLNTNGLFRVWLLTCLNECFRKLKSSVEKIRFYVED